MNALQRRLGLPVVLLILMVPASALADVAPVASSSLLTPSVWAIVALSAVAGYVTNAVNSGLFFGKETVPIPWLPYLTLFGSFLTALVASIAQAPVPSAAAWGAAVVAGIVALASNLGGVTAHQHLTAHLRTQLRKAQPKTPALGVPAKDAVTAAADKLNASSSRRTLYAGPVRAALVGMVSAVIVAGAAACGWWNNGGSSVVTQQAGATISCELGQIMAGGFTYEGLLACVGGVVSSLVADLESIFAYYTKPGPAPAMSGASTSMCADTTKPAPSPDAPFCLSSEVLANLHSIHIQARAKLAAADAGAAQ